MLHRQLLIFLLLATCFGHTTQAETVNATYSSASTIPLSANGYTATGNLVEFALNFAPTAGTKLTVVENTGASFIQGEFSNLTNGQSVTLPHSGIVYTFIANYFGGTGNDLVLEWAYQRLVAWGNNSHGQLGTNNFSSIPIALQSAGALAGKRVVSVAAGYYHTLALCSDGTLAAWGFNSSGQLGSNSGGTSSVPIAVDTTGVLAGKTVVAVAAGYNHSVALCSDGSIATWGNNSNGQLGNNSTGSSSVPVAVDTSTVLAGKTVVAIAAGAFHSMALCSDGTIATWGDNNSGQLGDDSTNRSTVPVAVSTSGLLLGKIAVSVAAGENYSVALCSDGTIATWGGNNSGQLGNNSTQNSSVPVAVITSGAFSGKTAVAIAASSYYSVALCSDGTIVEWGKGSQGDSIVPVTVDSSGVLSGKTVVAVTAGGSHSVVLCSDGTLAAWGANFNGQLGDNSRENSVVPVTVSSSGVLSGKPVVAVAAGGYHNVALCLDGTVAAWGDNNYGQLGNTSTGTISVPVSVNTTGVMAGKTVVEAAAGSYHGLASFSDGTVAAWGWDGYGQLGNDSTANFSLPVAVSTSGVLSGRKVVALAAGSLHTLALCSDGRVAAWGSNGDGQLGGNGGGSVPIAVNTTGVLFGKTVVAVAAGHSHSLALCSDGTLAAWGNNFSGQLGNNSTVKSQVPVAVNTTGVLSGKTVVGIAAGGSKSFALCSDGTVAAWGSGGLGNNSSSNSSVPVAVNTSGVLSGKSVVRVAVGESHTVALCSDGTLAAWGYNYYGQLGNNSSISSQVPVAVIPSGALSGKQAVSIAAGDGHSMALCSDGTIAAWGYNVYGQLGNNSRSTSFVPVAVSKGAGERFLLLSSRGPTHSLALLASQPVPQILDSSATNIGMGNATFQATVQARNNTTTVSFEYGPTTSYGSTVNATTQVTGADSTSVSASLTGLTPGLYYYYRVVATNAAGSTSSPEGGFFTLANNNADLSTLALSEGTLTPAFSENTTAYTVWVQQTTTSIAVTPTLADSNGSLTIAGQLATSGEESPALSLATGDNLIAIVAKAQDNVTTKTYSVTVRRLSHLESWRMTYFGSFTNSGQTADGADPDFDGLTNNFEFIAGLNPVDAASRFDLHLEPIPGQANQRKIIFGPTMPDRVYTVLFNTDLSSNWTPLASSSSSDQGDQRTVTDLDSTQPIKFYRVTVTKP